MGSAPFDKFEPATVRMENVCLTSGSCNMGCAPCEKFKPAMGLAVPRYITPGKHSSKMCITPGKHSSKM
jgi:hypothetical protein